MISKVANLSLPRCLHLLSKSSKKLNFFQISGNTFLEGLEWLLIERGYTLAVWPQILSKLKFCYFHFIIVKISHLTRLNPVQVGGYQTSIAQQISCHFQMGGVNAFSFGDFLSWSLYHPLIKLFLRSVSENLEKSDREDTWSTSILRQKLGKFKLINFFFNKLYFFVMNLNSTSVAQKLKIYNLQYDAIDLHHFGNV